MESISYEARINLAIEAIQGVKKLSLRAAAKIYNVSSATLLRRRASRPARRNIPANLRKLTDLEERTIVQYVIELSTRSFPPRLGGMEDMANHLLRIRDVLRCSRNWGSGQGQRSISYLRCGIQR